MNLIKKLKKSGIIKLGWDSGETGEPRQSQELVH